jgi:hypothetical protein
MAKTTTGTSRSSRVRSLQGEVERDSDSESGDGEADGDGAGDGESVAAGDGLGEADGDGWLPSGDDVGLGEASAVGADANRVSWPAPVASAVVTDRVRNVTPRAAASWVLMVGIPSNAAGQSAGGDFFDASNVLEAGIPNHAFLHGPGG